MNDASTTENVSPKEFSFGLKKSFNIVLIIISSLLVIGTMINLPTILFPSLYPFTMPISMLVAGIMAYYALSAYLDFNWKTIRKHLTKKVNILVFALCIAFYYFGLGVAEFLVTLFPKDLTPFIENLYRSTTQNFETFLQYKVSGFITICIVAPLVEEILFRGILLRGLLNHSSINPYTAIFYSAIIFGIVHMNPWQFLGAGTLGALFGFIYYRTKSLWLCIFLHALNNTISYLLMINYQSMEQTVTQPHDFTQVGINFAMMIALGWIIYKLTKSIRWN